MMLDYPFVFLLGRITMISGLILHDEAPYTIFSYVNCASGEAIVGTQRYLHVRIPI